MLIRLKDSTVVINKAREIYKLLKKYFKTLDATERDKEHFIVFHVNSKNHLKMIDLVSIGVLNQTLVHPREVFTRAVQKRSAYIFVAHNHPSGSCDPSADDLYVTQRLCEAGKVLSIPVLDHIIYTKKNYYSFKENGLI